MIKEWKIIPGYKNYSVSSFGFGRVKRIIPSMVCYLKRAN